MRRTTSLTGYRTIWLTDERTKVRAMVRGPIVQRTVQCSAVLADFVEFCVECGNERW